MKIKKILGTLFLLLLAVVLVSCSKKTFEVVFYDWDNTVLDRQKVKEGSVATAPKNPTREGYMFVAWCSDEGLTTSIDISKMPNANLTVYAKWAQMYEYFTIDNMTYVYYGTYPQTVVDDSSIISSLNSLTLTNANGYYEFEGEEYAKVVAHPCQTGYKFINGETITNGANLLL